MDCNVCGKPTPPDANVCSVGCMMISRHGGRTIGDAATQRHRPHAAQRPPLAAAALATKIRDMAKQPTAQEPKMPMILIRHPWFRHRNVVVGGTVLSFNGDGLCAIEDRGHAMADVQALLNRPGSQFRLVASFQPAEEPPVAAQLEATFVPPNLLATAPMPELPDLADQFPPPPADVTTTVMAPPEAEFIEQTPEPVLEAAVLPPVTDPVPDPAPAVVAEDVAAAPAKEKPTRKAAKRHDKE